jgi:DNA-binding beta-propeller fold protein YncE
MSATVTHAETYTFVSKWGSQGTGDGQFYAPCGIAVDSSGNVYVLDSGNSRIQKFCKEKITPTIIWSRPADIFYGTILSNTQFNAEASVPGTFVILRIRNYTECRYAYTAC